VNAGEDKNLGCLEIARPRTICSRAVKPAPFDYHAPSTIEEAVELLSSREGARVLAGGQSLVQLMKFRLAKPPALIDINGVAGLEAIDRVNGEVRVGALVRQQALLEDEVVASACPLLREAAQFVGYRETRRRGTLAGSLAFAAPWGELTAAAVALDASIEVRSVRGERAMPARDFFRGPHQTLLERDELIVGVRFPVAPPGSGAAFHEVSARYRDYAQVAAAAVVSPDRQAELVLLCVGPTPMRLTLDDDDRLDHLLADIEPIGDVEASATYRRRVAPVLARRALRDATAAMGRA
jgi:carbon-monoxide dehydrogenase medium subunit